MENDTFGGAVLAWVKSAKAFLKVQAGTGDNLLEDDIREGFTDYCLWSTFRPECIDTDGELDMECLDSGMVLFRENCTPGEALESSYRQAFGTDFDKDDIAVLMEECRRHFTWWGKNPPACSRFVRGFRRLSSPRLSLVIPAQAGISFPIRVQTVFRTPPLLRTPPLKPRRHHLKVTMPT